MVGCFFGFKNNFKFPLFYFCDDSVGVQDEAFESNSFFKATPCLTKK